MTDNNSEMTNPPPWWKQFWPWFLIALPGSVVIASFFTIKMAVDSDDGLVTQDYYKQGKAIHMDASARQRAHDLGILAKVTFVQPEGVVRVSVSSESLNAIGALQLALRHPTQANQDALLDLQPVGPNLYQAAMPDLSSSGEWNVELNAIDANWELRGRASVSSEQALTLQ